MPGYQVCMTKRFERWKRIILQFVGVWEAVAFCCSLLAVSWRQQQRTSPPPHGVEACGRCSPLEPQVSPNVMCGFLPRHGHNHDSQFRNHFISTYMSGNVRTVWVLILISKWSLYLWTYGSFRFVLLFFFTPPGDLLDVSSRPLFFVP